jgi:glycosyltransferase involved in cell wall biosynthesis
MENKVSLVIPAKNEESSIRELLDSIAGQTRRPDEVIVVDGGSNDRTPDIVSSYPEEALKVKLIRTAGAYPGTGRNIGIEAASHGLIALTDAGVVLDREWLAALLAEFGKDSERDVVFGCFEPQQETRFKRYSSLVFVPSKRYAGGEWIRTFSVASMLLKKDAWERAGRFPDFRAAEDKIFMERLSDAGCRSTFAPKAIVFWDIPPGPKEFFAKFASYSYHDIKAGKSRDWHLPVAKTYAGLILVTLLGGIISPALCLVFPLGLAVRAGKMIATRSEGSLLGKFDPLQFFGVIFCMLLVDAALAYGAFRYFIVRREPR